MPAGSRCRCRTGRRRENRLINARIFARILAFDVRRQWNMTVRIDRLPDVCRFDMVTSKNISPVRRADAYGDVIGDPQKACLLSATLRL